ncbi:hypothetical protein EWM64_g5830 [Hericium alpestre]|uniref:F-box domain-containing protein n=1 Tax=Hericium alpestre TaxID=135208 RepID=A0A4Y9ZWB1_9AGAM|nr:hypothetical protein EWM64_g5830 [Hericium alpestre]
MDAIFLQDITLPRLRDLTLCILSNACPGLPPLSLPSLQNLTFSLQYKRFVTVGVLSDWTVPEGDLHRIFTTVLSAYGPLLRRLHLNPVDWHRGWGDLVINNQLLLDYCPSLEHFITYAAGASKASHHPTLRWIDMWVPAERLNEPGSDIAHDPTAACVQDATNFPALQNCRFLDLCLSPIADLPVLLSPRDPLPRDGSAVRWTLPPFRISQTHERVTWADPYEYYSDSDSSYAPSSNEDEDSAEFWSSDDAGSESSESPDADPRFDVYRLAEGVVYP